MRTASAAVSVLCGLLITARTGACGFAIHAYPKDVRLTTPAPPTAPIEIPSLAQDIERADSLAFGRAVLTADFKALEKPGAEIDNSTISYRFRVEYGWKKPHVESFPLQRYSLTSCGPTAAFSASPLDADKWGRLAGVDSHAFEVDQGYLVLLRDAKIFRTERMALPLLIINSMGPPTWQYENGRLIMTPNQPLHPDALTRAGERRR